MLTSAVVRELVAPGGVVVDLSCEVLTSAGVFEAAGVVVPVTEPGGAVVGVVIVELSGGNPANVVEVAGCSSVVVSGAEDVTPACSTDNSGVMGGVWGAGVYG